MPPAAISFSQDPVHRSSPGDFVLFDLLEIKPMYFIGPVETGDNPDFHSSTGVEACGRVVDDHVENYPGFPHPTGCPPPSTGYPPVIPRGYPHFGDNPGSLSPQRYPRIMERYPR